MASIGQDVRFGVRMLFRNPGVTLAAVLALGLGIGLATAMFSIVYGALIRGLPVPEPERLMHLENANPSREEPSLEVFLHDFLDWRERQKSFEALAAYRGGTLNLSGDNGQPERYDGTYISANGFDVLRVKPILGRSFLPEEDTPQGQPAAILSYGVWKKRYQGDPKVLGRAVRINGQPGIIAGVMPQGFAFPSDTEVWTTLRLDPARVERGKGNTLEVMGRLRDGVSLEQARAEMNGLAKAIAAEYPKTNEGRAAVVKPWMKEVTGGGMATVLWTMFAFCLVVLLLACTNVASLMMARVSRRTREIAIRSSLGAGRWRLVAQLLFESLILSSLGAVLGVAFAYWGVKLFNAAIAGSNPPFWIRIAIDPAALAFALGMTVVAALVSGLLPALQASRTDVGEVLKDEGRGSSSLRLGRFSRLVVIGEVAFSCLLLVSAGLMIRSVVAVRTIDLGFEPKNLFTARVALFEAAYPGEAKRAAFFEDLLERLASQPEVATVAATTNIPGGGTGLWRYRLEGGSYPTERDLPQTHVAMVSRGFFDVFGARILAGRDFGRLDTAGGLPVVIVNQSFAAKVWPGQDPLGKRVRLQEELDETNPPWRTVVGVVPDLKMEGIEDNDGETPDGFYLPLSQRCPGFVSLTARSRTGNPLALTAVVRQQVNAIDPDLPIYYVYSMEQIMERGMFFPNLFASLFAIFGVAALLLASVGIYGVIAFSVNQRTQEIGIRMALGAQRRSVLRMILRQGMLQLGIGLLAGLLLAFFASRLLESILIGIKPQDPVTFTLVSFILATIAFIACWIPARRAMRTDPLVAIRYD
ncbi:MAG TPA: ABC transporter permease [Thermoanaerobaculia bacterium]|jgi:predicted permease|nr:ABC transporter permease [Thermoanaerobaculia bacterium]